MSFFGQLMWYTTKVGSDMKNAARELAMHMIYPGLEHWKAFGRLIGYLRVKKTKGIIVKNPKYLKAFIFLDSNYATNK